MSKPSLIYHTNPNDAIRGKRVVIEAQRFDKPQVEEQVDMVLKELEPTKPKRG
jgi:hypothetical protein